MQATRRLAVVILLALLGPALAPVPAHSQGAVVQPERAKQLVEEFVSVVRLLEEAHAAEKRVTYKHFYSRPGEIYFELRRLGPQAQRALLPLLRHANLNVRIQAALWATDFAPQEAKRTLAELAKRPKEPRIFFSAADALAMVLEGPSLWLRETPSKNEPTPSLWSPRPLPASSPFDRADFSRLVAKHGLREIEENLQKGLSPSLRFNGETGPLAQRVGGTRVGGLPDVAAGFQWPMRRGEPLSFIAQIALDEMAPLDEIQALPSQGMLYFFYDADVQPWGHRSADRDGWRVIYQDGHAPLAPALKPPRLLEELVFRPLALRPHIEMSWPCADEWEEDDLNAQPMSPAMVRRFEALLAEVEEVKRQGEALEDDAPKYRLLGEPDQIQNPMKGQCQFVSLGLDEESQPPAWARRGLGKQIYQNMLQKMARGSNDWRLLLQVDSDVGGTGMDWGSMGRIYFWIRKQDLEKRQFDKVWVVLQCT